MLPFSAPAWLTRPFQASRAMKHRHFRCTGCLGHGGAPPRHTQRLDRAQAAAERHDNALGSHAIPLWEGLNLCIVSVFPFLSREHCHHENESDQRQCKRNSDRSIFAIGECC